MDTTHYWPFAREYSMWNATAAALLFWMADLEPQILSDGIECICTPFFCSNSAQQLRNISEEILFSHFMTILNDTFKWELAQEDEGYDSGSESLNTPTPLRRAPETHHVSINENISFDPTTLLTTPAHCPEHSSRRFSSHSSVHCCLTFSSSNEESPTPDSSLLLRRAEPHSPAQHHHAGTNDSF